MPAKSNHRVERFRAASVCLGNLIDKDGYQDREDAELLRVPESSSRRELREAAATQNLKLFIMVTGISGEPFIDMIVPLNDLAELGLGAQSPNGRLRVGSDRMRKRTVAALARFLEMILDD